MKSKNAKLSESEALQAIQAINHGLATRNLNDPPERKKAIYAAFEARDRRFDGQIFAAVSSTGIYCRSVCPYHAKIENVTFYASAAEAEADGYRPCLACRPETAPGYSLADARSNLARRTAAKLRDNCTDGKSLEHVAASLGYTARHVRRVFEDEYGVTPAQYLLTCKLHLAKSLIADTDLPISRVATAAGFGSTRRFNAAFKEHYHLTPSEQRRATAKSHKKGEGKVVRLKLGYRPPMRFADLLEFFRVRALEGVELVDEMSYSRTACFRAPDGTTARGWIRVEDDPAKSALILSMSESLLPETSQVVARVRRMFDLDCEPHVIHGCLRALDDLRPGANVSGTRLPGCFEPFETCCRAVIGQQVSVAAANKMAARIVEAFGGNVDTGIPGLSRSFPTPERIASFDDIATALGPLGIIRSRSSVIAEIARLILEGELALDATMSPIEQMERLMAIKGIGPWTANYIAMRVLAYTDAFLETDAGVKHALPTLTPKERLAAVENLRPWRSYAVICLWNSLG